MPLPALAVFLRKVNSQKVLARKRGLNAVAGISCFPTQVCQCSGDSAWLVVLMPLPALAVFLLPSRARINQRRLRLNAVAGISCFPTAIDGRDP